MKNIEMIVEHEIANQYGIELCNISPVITDKSIYVRGRVKLSDKYDYSHNNLIIKGELLTEDDFIVDDLMESSLCNIKSPEDSFKLFSMLGNFKEVTKIRIYPVIYEKENPSIW